MIISLKKWSSFNEKKYYDIQDIDIDIDKTNNLKNNLQNNIKKCISFIKQNKQAKIEINKKEEFPQNINLNLGVTIKNNIFIFQGESKTIDYNILLKINYDELKEKMTIFLEIKYRNISNFSKNIEFDCNEINYSNISKQIKGDYGLPSLINQKRKKKLKMKIILQKKEA